MYSTGLTDRYGNELISNIDFTGHVLTKTGSISANKVVFITATVNGPYFTLTAGDEEDTINIGINPGHLISGINVRDAETGNIFSNITSLNSATATFNGPFVTTELITGPVITVTDEGQGAVQLQIEHGNLLQLNNKHEGDGTKVYTTNRLNFYTLTENGPYISLSEDSTDGLLIGIGGGSSSSNGITIKQKNHPEQTWNNITTLSFVTGTSDGPYFTYETGDTGELILALMPGTSSGGGSVDFYNHNNVLVKSANKVYMAPTVFSSGPYIDVNAYNDGVQLSFVGKFAGFSNYLSVSPNDATNLITGSYLWTTQSQNGPYLQFNKHENNPDSISLSLEKPSIIFAGQSDSTGSWVQKLRFASSAQNGPYINIESSDPSTGEYIARIYPGSSSGGGITFGGNEGIFNNVNELYFGTSSIGGPQFHLYEQSTGQVLLELDYQIPDRIINHTDTGILYLNIQPDLYNTYHTWSQLTTSGAKTINVSCNTDGGKVCLTWHLIIDLRGISTAPTITWNGTTINWLDGVPTIEAGKLHMISFQAINDTTIIGNLSYAL